MAPHQGPSSSDLMTPPPAPLAAPGFPPAAMAPPVIDVEFSEESPRQLRDYVRMLHKYRWVAATCFGVAICLTLLVTLLTPRLYTASTRLQVQRESAIQLQLKDNVLNLDDNDHNNVSGASTFLATQVATLKSRDLAERVIRKHHLSESDAFLRPGPQRHGLLSLGGNILTSLRPRGWEGRSTGTNQPETVTSGSIDPVLIDQYMRYLDVQDVRGTDLIEIRFTTPSPSLSAVLAAAHAQAYMDATDEAQLSTDITAKDFLDKQLRDSRDQVERADTAVKSFAEQHPEVAVNQEHKLIGQRITQLSQSVSEAEAHRISMQSRYEFMTKNANQPLAFLSDDNMGQGVQKLRLALIDLGVQRASMESRLGPNHPEMVDLARQGAEIRLQLLSEVGQEVAAAQARFQSAEMREDELRSKMAQLEQKAIDLQNLGTHYEMLKSEADNVRSLHDSLVKQQMETAVHSELAPSNIRVIERAEVPLGPSRPKVPLNLAIGVLAGIVGAVGATLVCENFDNSLKSSEDVESLLQLPTLATIPNFALARRSAQSRGIVYRSGAAAGASAQEVSAITSRFSDDHGRELVVLNEPWSPVAESFRALRTSVLFSTPGSPPKVILVTSTGASEGKTVTSLNLASTLAEAGSRVLLIDVDMRHPSCHRVLGVENERGLSTFLAGFAELPAIVHSLDAPRLFFIPSGPTPPNPAELVGSARMSQAIASLRESYDFVILDSPPVLPVTDAVVLTRESDGVVLVVKGHDTPRELVRRARDQLLLASAHLLGAVVNNVDLGWGDLYFYNRYYGGYYAPRPQAEQHA